MGFVQRLSRRTGIAGSAGLGVLGSGSRDVSELLLRRLPDRIVINDAIHGPRRLDGLEAGLVRSSFSWRPTAGRFFGATVLWGDIPINTIMTELRFAANAY